MTEERLELPQGTLDLLILKALALEPMHGWAISERLQQISQEALQVQQEIALSCAASPGTPRLDQGAVGNERK